MEDSKVDMLAWPRTLLGAVASASLTDWALLAGAAAVFLYWLGTRSHGHFRRRGLPFAPPLPFLGNMASIVFGRATLVGFLEDVYRLSDGAAAVGFFHCSTPIVVARDPELIKQMTVKAFEHFVDHHQFSSDAADPLLARGLTSQNGQRWKNMRSIFNTSFTSSKMRCIFKLFDTYGEEMVEFLKNELKSSTKDHMYEREMKEFFVRVTHDVIATSIIGIECNSLKHPTNELYRMTEDLISTEGFKSFVLFGYQTNRKVMEFLNLKFIRQEVHNFFHGLVHDTARERQKRGIHRPDILQLLMQVRSGELENDDADELETPKGARKIELDDLDMTAAALSFVIAGIQTTASAFSFCAYVLATHQEIQQRIQREVDEMSQMDGGDLSYESMQRLTYFDMFIHEVLRVYPPAVFTDRKCTKDFTFSTNAGRQYTVRKGEYVWLPIYSLHHDERFWPEPEKFDPERFSDENKAKINSFAYMPFSRGPRACIAARFAKLKMKIILSHFLREFSFVVSKKTPEKVKFAPNTFEIILDGGVWVGVIPRS